MQPNIDDSIERLYYLRDHAYKFDSIFLPYIICIMKIMVDLLTEIICLSTTALQEKPVEVLMNYIALGCIAGLDELVYNNIRSPLKE